MNTSFLEPALKFNEIPFHPNESGNMLLQFRERGYAIVPHVFEPDSVDPFRAQIESLVVRDEAGTPTAVRTDDPIAVYLAKAPRLLGVLRGAFMPWFGRPHPVLFHPSWVVKPANPEDNNVHGWHRDADHGGVTGVHGYTYPTVVHIAVYLADMTPEFGPTYVIPRSHRDPKLSPYGDAVEEPFLPRKSDVVVWDQRLWHRGSARTVPGLRMVAIFGFYAVNSGYRLSEAQMNALAKASSEEERILFGGPVLG